MKTLQNVRERSRETMWGQRGWMRQVVAGRVTSTYQVMKPDLDDLKAASCSPYDVGQTLVNPMLYRGQLLKGKPAKPSNTSILASRAGGDLRGM